MAFERRQYQSDGDGNGGGSGTVAQCFGDEAFKRLRFHFVHFHAAPLTKSMPNTPHSMAAASATSTAKNNDLICQPDIDQASYQKRDHAAARADDHRFALLQISCI
jgi:hypothetical protein